MYRIDCRSGYVLTDDAGRVVADYAGRVYRRPVIDGSWRVLGFARRWNSRQLVSLAEAAAGADIGHGFVHDLDHGTRRVWLQPGTRRAVRVRHA